MYSLQKTTYNLNYTRSVQFSELHEEKKKVNNPRMVLFRIYYIKFFVRLNYFTSSEVSITNSLFCRSLNIQTSISIYYLPLHLIMN